MKRLASFVLARLKPHLLCALALLWGGGILAADAYTFTAGTKIPLKENDAIASWMTTDFAADKLGEYGVSENIQAGSKYFEFSLNNETQGSYYLSVSGYNASEAVTLTVTASGTDYSRSASAAMPKVASWNDQYYSDYHFLLDDLPAGNFTLRVTAKRNNGSAWLGYYKDFTLVKISEAPYKLTGEPYDLATLSGTALALADGNTNGRLTITTTSTADYKINIDSANNAIGSTHSGDTIVFWLSCSRDAKCMFKYSASNNSGGTATVNWSLIGNGGNSSFSDSIEVTGNWDTFADNEHDLGTLAAGKYILIATLSTAKNWAGNYKEFIFTLGSKIDITKADGLQLDADADWTRDVVTIEDGAVVDLHGHNLVAGSITANTRGVVFTNSLDAAESLSTLTIDGETLPKSIFGGNLKVVQTGTDKIEINGSDYGANTHTGGTTLSASQIKLRSANQFGSGAIALTGGVSFDLTSNGYDYTNWKNDFNVTGTGNSIYLGGASTPSNYSFAGALTGDGETIISSGWQASITMTGDLSAFTGTFRCKLNKKDAGRGLWLNPANTVATPGMPKASVVMADPGSDSGYPENRLFIEKSGDVEFGSLATAIDENDNETYFSTVYAASGAVNLKVGAKEDATYSGRLCDYNNSVLSVEKVGANTKWTLTGSKHNFGGTFTVSEGTVVFANKTATAMGSKVVVKSGAAIGVGGGTLTTPVEFEDGAKVKLTNESTDETYTILTAAADSSGTPTVETDAEYSNGTWKTKWTTNADDGTKTLTASFNPHGLIIILR